MSRTQREVTVEAALGLVHVVSARVQKQVDEIIGDERRREVRLLVDPIQTQRESKSEKMVGLSPSPITGTVVGVAQSLVSTRKLHFVCSYKF